MRHGSLFNGIGGFQLAAEWMGWDNIMSCEIDEFCNKVTKYHFPNCIQHHDIRSTDFTVYRGNIDIITGGFPCQPYSTAGKRLGKEDERHLWPEMLRAIREIQPTWIVGENVLGIVSWNGGLVFDEVQADLEAEGYEVQPYVLPACAVNAPHRRDRVWFIAYSTNYTRYYENNTYKRTPSVSQKRSNAVGGWANFTTINNGYDGLPERLDTTTISGEEWTESSIKAGGNAIVPQVALQIFKSIEQYQKAAA